MDKFGFLQLKIIKKTSKKRKINNIEHLSLELLSLIEVKNSVLDISHLSTKHKRLKSYRGQFGLVEPLELFLGEQIWEQSILPLCSYFGNIKINVIGEVCSKPIP